MVATIVMIFSKKTHQKYRTASPGGGATTLGGGTAVLGSGTPDTGCGTPFRPVPAEFNHCLNVNYGVCVFCQSTVYYTLTVALRTNM